MQEKKISVDQAVSLAQEFALAGKYGSARALYTSILEKQSDNRKAAQGLRLLQNETTEPDSATAVRDRKAEILALFSGGKMAEAFALIQELLQLYPEVPFLYATRGLILAGKGQYEQAVNSYLRALRLNPGLAEVYNNLGSAYKKLGQMDKSIACFKQALKMNPGLAETHFNLGNYYADLQCMDEAKAHYRKAVAISPSLVMAHNNLGTACRALGQTEQAAECFRKALEGNPEFVEAYYNLRDLKQFSQDEMDRMLALLKKQKLESAERIHLCFALFRGYEDAGQYEKALEYLNEGNRLRSAKLGYSIDKDRQAVEQRKQFFTKNGSLGDAGDYQPAAKKPIFIIGMPRSGTTLVEQILASHSEVFGGGELTSLGKLASAFCARHCGEQAVCEESAWKQGISEIRTGYLRSLEELNIAESIVTDKMPGNFLWLGFICQAFPEAKIIHLNRDPVATCWSIYSHCFTNKGVGYAYDMKDLAEYYRLYRQLMGFWKERFPGRVYDLDYEQLTESQEAETRRLLEHCGLEWESSCLDFHKTERVVKTASASQVRKKMYRGSSEAWKKYEWGLQPLVAALRQT